MSSNKAPTIEPFTQPLINQSCLPLPPSFGVKSFILFPKIADSLKSNYAEESYNINGLVPRALQMIKSKFPEVVVCTDVALDPYSSQVSAACV